MSPWTMPVTDPSLTSWADYLRSQAYSIRTIRHRTRVVAGIARACGVAPQELTRDLLLDHLTAGGFAPGTRENYLVSVRQYCEWAGLEDITAKVRRAPIPRRVPKPVSEAGLARMLAITDRDSPTYAYLVLGAYIGTRSAETAAVRARDLEESGDGWALRIVGKGGVERLVPAPPIVVRTLRPWIQATRRGGRLWPEVTPSQVQHAVRRVAEAAGVRCSSHQLRHRYGTAVYRVSRDLLLLQRLMGHASPMTTAGYAAVALEDAADIVMQLPGADTAEAHVELPGALDAPDRIPVQASA